MTEEIISTEGATVSDDAVVHFDITPGVDYPLENPKLEDIVASEEAVEALEEEEEE
jgi:hypothetical protein